MLTIIQRFQSRLRELFSPGGQIFYGWWIVLACAGVQWLAAVTWMYSYGAYAILLQADFGWSMSVLSLAFALTRLESGLLGPIQGWLVDRFGPRRILTIGTSIFGLGFFVFNQVDSIQTYFISFVLIALGSSLGGFATLMVSIVNWFDRNRAKAIAWSQVGFSLGGLSMPLVALGLEAFGWRNMAIFSGCLVLLIGLPLVQIVRHRPEEIGEAPDGQRSGEDPATLEFSQLNPVSLTWQQAIRLPSFWLISAGHGFALLTVSSMLMHLIPFLTQSINYSLAKASLVFALMTSLQFVGLVTGGYLGDRYNKRLLCVFCMVGHSAGLLCLTYGDNAFWFMLFALLHGTAWGVRGPLMVALRADYFGTRSFGTIMGISSLIVMIGMTLGPIICGYLFDLYGNYRIAFTAVALASLTGSICFLFAKPAKL